MSNFILDLTIAIPVRNEEQNLPKCLAAIGPDLARHVVVIDSGSTDKTTLEANGSTDQLNIIKRADSAGSLGKNK